MSNWLLLRGLARGNGHWGDFPKILRDRGINVEFMEIPGNGTCAHETTPMDPDILIENLRDRCAFLKDHKPFYICAISLGAMIALKWAEKYPEEIQALVVINTSLSQLSPFYRRLQLQNYAQLFNLLLDKNYTHREKKILEITSNSNDKAERFLTEFAAFSTNHPVQLKNFIRQLMLANAIRLDHKIKIPVDVAVSEKDRLVSASCSIQLADFLNTSPHLHPTAGHDLPLDDPEWLADIIGSHIP